MAVTAELNKTEYDPGDLMVLTVRTEAGDRDRDYPINVHISVGEVGEVDVVGKVNLPDEPVVVTDSARIWQKESDDGLVAVFKATA